MKKTMAILLMAAMLTGLFAFSVGAANVIGGNDGVGTFDPKTSDGQDLNVKVTQVTHKYAVDVTFALEDLTIGGSITWNVTTMRYDVEGGTLENTTRSIEISNRSDLPVYAYATVSNTDGDNGITVTAEKDSATNTLEVAKAKPGSGANNGTATDGTLTISIKSNDWNAVAEYYIEKKLADENQESFRIATVTVTISKTKSE